MRGNTGYQSSGEFVFSKAYEEVFIRRVHQLLGMGYVTMPSNDFSDAQEEDITGELVRAIDSVLDNSNAPTWTDSFSIHEEPRIHTPNRKGKRRRRLDIRVDSSEIRPRSRLSFEAKRLGANQTVASLNIWELTVYSASSMKDTHVTNTRAVCWDTFKREHAKSGRKRLTHQ